MPRRASHSGLRPISQTTDAPDRPHIIAKELDVGCIVWLPSKDSLHLNIKCDKDICCGSSPLDDGGHNHPVVVLSIKQKPDSHELGDLVCCIACLTSFSELSRLDYHNKRSRNRHHQNSIPIKNYDPVMELDLTINHEAAGIPVARGVELELERCQKLKKQSYVRLDHTYEVPVEILRRYTFNRRPASEFRLSKESYIVLMERLDLIPRPWSSTKSLSKPDNLRLHKVLANSLGRYHDTSSQNTNVLSSHSEHTSHVIADNTGSYEGSYPRMPQVSRPDIASLRTSTTASRAIPYNSVHFGTPITPRTNHAQQQSPVAQPIYGTIAQDRARELRREALAQQQRLQQEVIIRQVEFIQQQHANAHRDQQRRIQEAAEARGNGPPTIVIVGGLILAAFVWWRYVK